MYPISVSGNPLTIRSRLVLPSELTVSVPEIDNVDLVPLADSVPPPLTVPSAYGSERPTKPLSDQLL